MAAILSAMGKGGKTLFYDITGVATIIWVLLLMYIVFAVAFNPELRNSFVRKLAGMKEHDERETQLTGFTSKKTFIFMTGILVLLLF